MKRFITLALAAGVLSSAPVFADSIPDIANNDTRLEFVRTTPELKKIIRDTRHPEPRPTSAPTFAIKTRNNAFIMTIGGSISPILGWDIGNNLYQQDDAGISFVTSAIPVPAVRGKKADFYINPLNSYLDFSIIGLQGTPNQISAYIKIGTNGNNMSLVLQRAYATWRRFTAGMKLTLMQDGYACQPPTIDPEGPSGCISNVAYEIGYTSKSYSGFSFAAALDMPTFYSSNGYYRGKDFPKWEGHKVYGNAEQVIPDVPAWIQYQYSQWNRVRFSALLRNFAYRDEITNKTRHHAGWGVMLSGNLQPVKPLIIYYQFAYGHGIGNYLQDIAGKPISFVPDPENVGRVKASPMMGANIGVSINATSKLQFNLMFSESRIWNVENYCNALPEAQNYKYALYGAANCFYNITPYLQWGIEYLWGRRQTWNIGGANDNRIQTQIAFNF